MRALFLLSLVACARAEGDPKMTSTTEGPLVLELFTSQGCSSCPPADQLLGKLARSGMGDHPLAPLSFHVDYWNDLGWADPFSSAAWTARQQQYARVLNDRVYTPELVVGGQVGMVGSNSMAVTRAIQTVVRPTLLPATASWTADALSVTATAPDDADVWIAVWEESTSTHVPRGENAGETLGSDRVVRRFERVATAGKKAQLAVKLDRAWHGTGAVAFAQRPDGRIVASAMLPH